MHSSETDYFVCSKSYGYMNMWVSLKNINKICTVDQIIAV